MIMLPACDQTPLLRTDFSADGVWQSLVAMLVQDNEDGFRANLAFIDDERFAGVTVEELAFDTARHAILLIADHETFSANDRALLCILADAPEQRFRVVPGQAWSVENNLSLGNMDFGDFVKGAGNDGVFRGFD